MNGNTHRAQNRNPNHDGYPDATGKRAGFLPLNAIRDLYSTECTLSTNATAVATALVKHARTGGGFAFPSVPLIAAETRLSPRSVRRARAELEAAGYIVTQHANGRSNTYRLRFGWHSDPDHRDQTSSQLTPVTVTGGAVTVAA